MQISLPGISFNRDGNKWIFKVVTKFHRKWLFLHKSILNSKYINDNKVFLGLSMFILWKFEFQKKINYFDKFNILNEVKPDSGLSSLN